jgi:hypothetical protein
VTQLLDLSPNPAPQPTTGVTTPQLGNGGVLLGGLLCSVVNTLGGTVTTVDTVGGVVGTVTTTVTTVGGVANTVGVVLGSVGGVVGSVGHILLAPVGVGGGTTAPARPLLGLNDLLPVFGSPSTGGGTVTVLVPVRQPAGIPFAVQPQGPQQPAAPAIVRAQGVRNAVDLGDAVSPAIHQQPAENPGRSDEQAGAPASGGSGERRPPSAPSAPVAPASSITAAHDYSGSSRQHLAILGSSANTTQLRLIGTSLDPEVDGAGRDAALPTTSPD